MCALVYNLIQAGNKPSKKQGIKTMPTVAAEKSFKKYFWSFYGKTGLYPETLTNLTALEFWNAMDMRLKGKLEFDGDSIDRELVRDIILASRGKFTI